VVRKYLIIIFLIFFVISVKAFTGERSKVNLTSYILCSLQERNRNLYVIQFHLLADSTATIIPDTLSKIYTYFIDEVGDTTFIGCFDTMYHLGFNLGTIKFPCPDGNYPITVAIKGREYWFVLYLPILEEWGIKSVLFRLDIKVKSDGILCRETVSTIIDLE